MLTLGFMFLQCTQNASVMSGSITSFLHIVKENFGKLFLVSLLDSKMKFFTMGQN